jgi:hypothetical protein
MYEFYNQSSSLGIPTTRHGKLVTATIRHTLLIYYKTIGHMLEVCYKKMCDMPHRNSLQYLLKNGHFNNHLNHLCASKQEFRWFLVNSTIPQ